LLLAMDAIYTMDPEIAGPCPARVPHLATNWDTELACRSIARLATLGATSARAGHGDAVTGEVKGQLEQAARLPEGFEAKSAAR
jgi:hypothetical protein